MKSSDFLREKFIFFLRNEKLMQNVEAQFHIKSKNIDFD